MLVGLGLEQIWEQVRYRSALWASVTAVLTHYSIASITMNLLAAVK